MAKIIEKEVLLQQTLQKTELISRTETFRKNIIYSLTLDNSASMFRKKNVVLSAAKKIFNKLEDHDRLEFALFGRSHHKIHGPKKKKYVSWDQNKDKVECNEEATALYDSICDTIDQFPRDAKYKGYDKAMVVLTDGEDNVSRNNFETVIAKLKSLPIPNCKFFLVGVELSERVKQPFRQISDIPNCSFLEADQVNQVATVFKEISKKIFIKRTTTIHINSPSGNSNNNRISIANNDDLSIIRHDPSPAIVTVSTTIIKEPCTFFARGLCKYGDSCKYSHEIIVPVAKIANHSDHSVPQIKPVDRVKAKNKAICTFFQSPSGCAKGDNCSFSHVKVNSNNNNSNYNNNNNLNNNNNKNNNNNNNNNNNRNNENRKQNQNKKRS